MQSTCRLAVTIFLVAQCWPATLPADDFDNLLERVQRLPTDIPAERGQVESQAARVSDADVSRRKELLIEAGRRQPIIQRKPSPTTQFPISMCRLRKDPQDADALTYLPVGLRYRGKDNTFGKCMLARLYYQFQAVLPEATRQAILHEATSYDGFLSGGTENHIAMRRIAGLLFGEAFPQELFHFSLSGEQLAGICRQYARNYGRAVFHNSMVEYLSPGYHAVNTSGWINLAELSGNDESRLLGRAVLDWMMIDLALNWHSGQIVPPLTRDKGPMKNAYQLSYPRQPAQWNAWLYFGGCTIPEDETALSTPEFMDNLGSGFNLAHAVSGWAPHPVVRNIGAKQIRTPITLLQSRCNWEAIEPSQLNAYGKKTLARTGPADPRYNLRSVYVDRDYAVGAGYRRADIMDPIVRHAGSFAVVWKSKRPQNRLFVVHPYWYTARKDEKTGQPWGKEDWNGTSPFLQMAHWENAAVLLCDIPARDPYEGPLGIGSPLEVSDRTAECVQELHVYLPTSMDQETQSSSAWFFREGDVYVAVVLLRPGARWEASRYEGYRRLVLPGGMTGVKIEVGDRREFGSLEQFQGKVTSLAPDASQLDSLKSVVCRTTRGNTLQLRHNSSDWLPLAAVDGTPLDFSRWPICASPYVNCRDGVLDVRDDRAGFTIDWSGDLPEYVYYDLKDGQKVITRRERLVDGKLRVD